MLNRTALLEFFGFDAKEETLRTTINENFYKSNFTYNTDFDLSNQYLSIEDDFSNLKQKPLGSRPRSSIGEALVNNLLVLFSSLLLIITLPFSLVFCLKFCASYEKIVVLRLGLPHKIHGNGGLLVLPFIDKVHCIDVRTKNVELPELNVITADKGIISIKVVVFYQVSDPLALVCTLKDKDDAIKDIAQTTLHNKVSKSTVADIANSRSLDRILEYVNDTLKKFVVDTGIVMSDLKVLDAKVVKEPDNTTLNTFHQIMKSDAGKQMFGMIGEAVKETLGQDLLSGFQPQPPLNDTFNMTPQCLPKAGPSNTNPGFNRIISKISMCCDSSLVSKVGRRYRIVCDCSGSVEIAELDLCHGAGSISVNASQHFNPHVTISLALQTLNDLITGDLSPLTAYLNGSVKIEGCMEDVITLKFLSEKARDLKLN
ncbi:unnamed protein product [Bursaphelenchus xylophilus]|uniref:(pine wood nematode) hypothetical protein n=1 Tax=Bursaphelenchus xylophilus TaxID=6326 RepID=A0A1I7S364_BURXY|nr:unnamed protein product [Bursaphelenchus xylophilus]CAG9116110.1 unnamed protein product [Bursaphelenchus xylophilus]